MPSYEFVTVDVFTDRAFGGNPLAVFPEARGLGADEMEAIAREFNYAETTFVLPPDDPANSARVRIFTPKRELPFAGHPNVGTAFVLAGRWQGAGDVFRFEQDAGLVSVRVFRRPDGRPDAAELDAPRSLQIGEGVPTDTLAACVGLDPADIRTDSHHPLSAGTGLPFVIAEVTGRAALAAARPDWAGFRDAAEAFPDLAQHFSVHLYARDETDPVRLYARMFSPLLGVPEDPATGSANAALAALLVSLAPGEDVELAFDILQGVEMGRPSRLAARASKTAEGAVTASIGGSCVPMMRGVIDL